MTRLPCRTILALLAVAVLGAAAPGHAQGVRAGSDTSLPVPRFVSLKSDAVNVRRGPSRDGGRAARLTRAIR